MFDGAAIDILWVGGLPEVHVGVRSALAGGRHAPMHGLRPLYARGIMGLTHAAVGARRARARWNAATGLHEEEVLYMLRYMTRKRSFTCYATCDQWCRCGRCQDAAALLKDGKIGHWQLHNESVLLLSYRGARLSNGVTLT